MDLGRARQLTHKRYSPHNAAPPGCDMELTPAPRGTRLLRRCHRLRHANRKVVVNATKTTPTYVTPKLTDAKRTAKSYGRRIVSPSTTHKPSLTNPLTMFLASKGSRLTISGTSLILTVPFPRRFSKTPRAWRWLPSNFDCGRETPAEVRAGSGTDASPCQPQISVNGHSSQWATREVHTVPPRSIIAWFHSQLSPAGTSSSANP